MLWKPEWVIKAYAGLDKRLRALIVDPDEHAELKLEASATAPKGFSHRMG